jgi:hypothetical protein
LFGKVFFELTEFCELGHGRSLGSLKDVINLLDPQAGRRAPAVESKAGTRKPRQVKVYKNPHNGEVVETKGGNHKTLKEWKVEYGADTVESWLTK